MGCSIEEAQEFADAYIKGFKGITEFKEKGSKFVRKYGYILLNPITGHKTYWWDHKEWLKRQKSFDSKLWRDSIRGYQGLSAQGWIDLYKYLVKNNNKINFKLRRYDYGKT